MGTTASKQTHASDRMIKHALRAIDHFAFAFGGMCRHGLTQPLLGTLSSPSSPSFPSPALPSPRSPLFPFFPHYSLCALRLLLGTAAAMASLAMCLALGSGATIGTTALCASCGRRGADWSISPKVLWCIRGRTNRILTRGMLPWMRVRLRASNDTSCRGGRMRGRASTTRSSTNASHRDTTGAVPSPSPSPPQSLNPSPPLPLSPPASLLLSRPSIPS